MKKKIKKSLVVFCVALSVFVCNLMVVSADTCSKSSDGYHHFNHHYVTDPYDVVTTHQYLYGYDVNNIPIYKTCVVTTTYRDCQFACTACGIPQDSSIHTHVIVVTHSGKH